MTLLRVNNLRKTFGGNILFDKVSFDVQNTDRIALIGRNGVGKSTLVKMILKEIAPDSGDIFIFGGTTIGYLSQDVLEDFSHRLIDEMNLVFSEHIRLEKEIRDVLSQMETNHSEELLNRYARLETKFSSMGGYEYHTQIDMILTKFGFKKEEYDRVIQSFSGGERTRIAFAKLLLQKPDLLLLDEPTNHMDIEIIEWLEEYLKRYTGSVFVITHDKYFINKVADKILELDQETMQVYHGKFEEYEVEKVRRYEQLMGEYLRQKKQIDHLQSFVDRFRYKANLAKSAQDRIKKIARIERIDKPTNSSHHVKMTFHSRRPTDAVILSLSKCAIGYEQPLYSNIDLDMRGYEKIGIIGRNGAGKTTLVKTILGSIPPLLGSVDFLKDLKIGYFDQNLEGLNEQKTLLETIHDIYPMKTLGEVRSLLAKVLFVSEDVYKKVEILSGGERVRLKLLMLMLEEPELLILDEPTNHLDIDTKTIVEDVFEEYIGPMIFISHDRYFINKVATKILSMEEGILVFEGNYDEFKEFKASQKPIEQVISTRTKRVNRQKQIAELERNIDNSLRKLDMLKASLYSEEVYQDKKSFASKQAEIKALEEEIENMVENLENFHDEDVSSS